MDKSVLKNFIYLCILILLIKVIIRPDYIPDDCAVHYEAGFRLIHGQIPYIDFIETNLPMIFYINAIPAWLSETFHGPAYPVFSLFNIFMLASIFIFCNIIINQAKDAGKEYRYLLSGLGLFYVFTSGLIGQREFIITLFFLPYLFLEAFRFDHKTIIPIQAVLVGFLAGVAIAIKPNYGLILIGYELVWCLKTQNLKKCFTLENISLMVTLILYLIHFLLLPSVESKELFGNFIPLLVYGYKAFDIALGDLILTLCYGWTSSPSLTPVPFLFVIPLSLVLLWGIFLRKKFLIIDPLMAWLIAGIVVYLWQAKGFSTHTLLMLQGYYALAIIEIYFVTNWFINNIAFLKRIQFKFISFSEVLFLILLLILSPLMLRYGDSLTVNQLLKNTINKYCKPQDYIMVLSGRTDSFPNIYGCRLGTRYLSIFVPESLFAYIKDHPCKYFSCHDIEKQEALMMSNLIEDLNKYQPTLIAIENTTGKYNMATYFKKLGFINYCLKHNYFELNTKNSTDKFIVRQDPFFGNFYLTNDYLLFVKTAK